MTHCVTLQFYMMVENGVEGLVVPAVACPRRAVCPSCSSDAGTSSRHKHPAVHLIRQHYSKFWCFLLRWHSPFWRVGNNVPTQQRVRVFDGVGCRHGTEPASSPSLTVVYLYDFQTTSAPWDSRSRVPCSLVHQRGRHSCTAQRTHAASSGWCTNCKVRVSLQTETLHKLKKGILSKLKSGLLFSRCVNSRLVHEGCRKTASPRINHVARRKRFKLQDVVKSNLVETQRSKNGKIKTNCTTSNGNKGNYSWLSVETK